MVRNAPRPIPDAVARRRSSAHAAKFLLRSAGPAERAGVASALELVGIAAVLYLRLRTTALQKSHNCARHICGVLSRARHATRLSRNFRRLFRAVRIVRRDLSGRRDHLYLY